MGILSEIGTVLKSNIAINKIGQDLRRVADRRIMSQDAGMLRSKLGYNGSFMGRDGIQNASGKTIENWSKDISDKDRLKSMIRNKDGSYNKTMIGGAIAGSYVGVSSSGRIASGGGLYKDSDGNTDLMGVPLI